MADPVGVNLTGNQALGAIAATAVLVMLGVLLQAQGGDPAPPVAAPVASAGSPVELGPALAAIDGDPYVGRPRNDGVDSGTAYARRQAAAARRAATPAPTPSSTAAPSAREVPVSTPPSAATSVASVPALAPAPVFPAPSPSPSVVPKRREIRPVKASEPAAKPYVAGADPLTVCGPKFTDVDAPPSQEMLDACHDATITKPGWVDRGRASGATPALVLQGDVRNPRRVRIWAEGSRYVRVTVSWNMICTTDGSVTVGTTAGLFDLARRESRDLRLAEGTDCTVTAVADSTRGFRAQIIAE